MSRASLNPLANCSPPRSVPQVGAIFEEEQSTARHVQFSSRLPPAELLDALEGTVAALGGSAQRRGNKRWEGGAPVRCHCVRDRLGCGAWAAKSMPALTCRCREHVHAQLHVPSTASLHPHRKLPVQVNADGAGGRQPQHAVAGEGTWCMPASRANSDSALWHRSAAFAPAACVHGCLSAVRD